MSGLENENKPTIVLLLSDSCPNEWIRHVGAGCEEEGVPLAWDKKAEGKAASLAREAAVQSRLEVGVGVDERESAVTIFSLSEHPPYITAFHSGNPEVLRWLGHNASRLVKREPLLDKEKFLARKDKGVLRTPKAEKEGFYDPLIEQIAASVIKELGRIGSGGR